jgi:hypothetical protein
MRKEREIKRILNEGDVQGENNNRGTKKKKSF